MKSIITKIFFCILVLAVLTACSMPRILYNNADLLLLNWFDDYFELNKQQRSDLKKGIGRLLDWHRKSELPKIILFLEDLKFRYEQGISEEDIKWSRAQSEQFLERILYHFEGDLVSVLLTIEDSQILRMKKKLFERNEQLVKQSKMSSIELHEHILDWVYETLEDWLGYLGSEQKQKIAGWVKPDSNWIAIKLKNRKKTQADLTRLLQSKELLKENLHAWMYHIESHWTDEFKIHVKAKKREWIGIFLKVDAITRSNQRKHAAKELQYYIDNFKELTKL